MIKFLFRKITGKKDPKDPQSSGAKLAVKLRENSEKLTGFLGEKFELAQEEYSSIKEKCKDLRSTNYNLGMRHMENGNLPEAIFRFKIIKKFWPDNYDAYYQLAYCLTLQEKFLEARKVLEELLSKKPDFNPVASELLVRLNQINSDAKTS